MSELAVTRIKTLDSVTPLTISTGNASAGFIKMEAGNNRVTFNDVIILAANNTAYVTSNLAIGTTFTGQRLLNLSGDHAIGIFGQQAQYSSPFYIGPTNFPTSNRAAMNFDLWTLGQDSAGNGTKDFYLYGGSTGDTRFVIDTNGFFGIANTNPQANLHIDGNFFVSQNNASSLTVVGEIAEFAHNSNSYAQIHVRNANTGTRASGDLVVTADIGTDTSDFINLGINNSNFADPNFTIVGAKDGYLYTSNGNLAIGTANVGKSLEFFTGGSLSTNERMHIDPSGNVGINTSNGVELLTVNGGIGSVGNLANAFHVANGVYLGLQSYYATIELVGATSTGSLIDFSAPGEDFRGRIVYFNSGNTMQFYTAGQLRQYMDGTGNVGIGINITNPTSTLLVSPPANMPNTVNIVGNTIISGAVYANSFVGVGQGFANMNVISTVGSQVWNVPPGVRRWKVTAIGGGSQGGGSHALAGATGASGAPGGVVVRIFEYVSGVNQMTFNVGIGGISVTAVNANGAAGFASNVNYNGIVLLANGATGGANSWFGGNVNAIAVGGPASGGQINLSGASGNPGGTAAATSPLTGMAPATPLGYGQSGQMVATLTGGGGANATGFGAAGGGSRAGTGTTLWRGGFGSNGAIIIEW